MSKKKSRFVFPLIIAGTLCLAIVVSIMWSIVSSMQYQTAQDYKFLQKDLLQKSSYINKSITAFYKIENFQFSGDLSLNIKTLQDLAKSIAGYHKIARNINIDLIARLPKDDPLMLRLLLEELQPKLQAARKNNEYFFTSLGTVSTNQELQVLIEKGKNDFNTSILVLEEYQNLHPQLQSYFFSIRKKNTLKIIERLNAFIYILGFLLGLTGLLSFLYLLEKSKLEKALITSHHLLEDKVKERTTDLRMSNEQLSKEIEEREQVEFDLRLQRDALENSLNGFNIVDESGKFIFVNKAYTQIWGYDNKDEIIDTTPVLHCQDSDIPRQIIAELKNTGSCVKEFVARRKDGSFFDVLMYARLAHDETGREIYPTTSIDITERKQSEEKLNKTAYELRERLKELNCLYQISELSSDEKITTEEILQGIANIIPAAWQYSELTSAQITIGDQSYTSEGFKESAWFQSQQIMDIGGTAGEVQVFLSEEKPEIDEGPFLKEERELLNVIAERIGAIVTRKKAEDEKSKLESRLQQAQKMEAIGTLAGGIAHDFNNILTSLMGFTELALEEAPVGSGQRDDLEEVLIAGNRAKELVQQILTFARQSEEETKPVRLSDIVTEALKLLRPSTPTTIEIKPVIKSTAKVMGNASQLHQVVMNLCTNAIHSLQKSGGILEIDLRSLFLTGDSGLDNSELSTGEYLKLMISDNGPGIDPAIIENIFEPYYTTKGVGEGSGMGLAMVKGLVEKYGGDINVTSEVGQRTSFVIRLPIATGRTSDVIQRVDQVASGTERILLVDDEPPIAQMGSRILERLGYTVTARTSSFEALELFKEKPDAFDLIITDMTMPAMTGDILSMEIRTIRRDIPIIICTGYSNTINDERAKQIGVDAFAYKPFTKSDLAKTIRTVLDAS